MKPRSDAGTGATRNESNVSGSSNRSSYHGSSGPQVDHYQPMSRRRRLLIALLALATAATVMYMVLEKPGGTPRVRKAPEPCTPSRTQGCVGGKVEVIVVPPASDPAPATTAR